MKKSQYAATAFLALTLTICLAVALGESITDRLSAAFTFITCAAGAGSAIIGLYNALKKLDDAEDNQ